MLTNLNAVISLITVRMFVYPITYVITLNQINFFSGDIGNYYYGQGHPMKPHRIRMTHNLLLNYGLYRKMEIYVSFSTFIKHVVFSFFIICCKLFSFQVSLSPDHLYTGNRAVHDLHRQCREISQLPFADLPSAIKCK